MAAIDDRSTVHHRFTVYRERGEEEIPRTLV